MNKINKISRSLCLGLGVASILSVFPAYASEPNSVSSVDEEITIQDNCPDIQFEETIPTNGNAKELNVGWTSHGGIRYYCKDESRIKVTGWQQIDNKWYYFNTNDCSMQTGWLNDGGTWYYLTNSSDLGEGNVSIKKGLGAMKTGWLNDNGTWYYLNSNGSMAANTTIDGYVLGPSGAWIQ